MAKTKTKTKTRTRAKKEESNAITKLGSNIVTNLKEHWKLIASVVGPLVVLAIIFALPLKTVPIQVTETYWDTEMKQEPYTVSEPYTDTETYTTTEMQTKTVYDSYVDAGNWSYVFNVDKANSKVSINFYGFPYYAHPQCDMVCTTSEASSCRV
ncbi:MAG: hypothetical protein FJ022_06980, partial [Chloroflexi bacterium]|nr:hypothetical protein [Chloroflexota bacterium]